MTKRVAVVTERNRLFPLCTQHIQRRIFDRTIRGQNAALDSWIYNDDCIVRGPLGRYRDAVMVQLI